MPERAAAVHPLLRLTGWWLPFVGAVTPLVVITTLVRPYVGQSAFFEVATMLALFVSALALAVGVWRPPLRPTVPIVLLLLLGVFIGLSLTASQSPLFSLKHLLLPFSGVVYFALIIGHPLRRAILNRLGLGLIAVGGLLAIYGILQYNGIEFLPFSEQVRKNRVIATIGHPNYLASVLGPIVFVTLGYVIERRTPAWILGGLLLVFVILTCILMAQTRGVWLGLVIGFLVLVLVTLRYCLKYRVGIHIIRGFAVSGMLLIGGLTIMLFIFLPRLNEEFDLRERITAVYQIKSRLYYWRAAIDMARAKPWFGQGPAMFDPLFWIYALEQQKSELGPYYRDVIPAISETTPGHTHNEYLQVYAENGTLGLSALVAFLAFFIYFGYFAIMRQRQADRALQGAAMYGALLMILADAMFAFPWRLPVSLIVFIYVLAWHYDEIHSGADADQVALTESAGAPA
ncbi:MAG TPA: O-antigen ligase [Candidatus Sumerlaeota bacterium]|nr:O-antigen ligase [Candidatus Sumerlaeota bacterium]